MGFQDKKELRGSIQKLKGRLVAKSFYQNPVVDFKETIGVVVKAFTIQIMLTLVASHDWNIRQLDINNVFLNRTLDEGVYMKQPRSFVDKQRPQYV